MSCAVFTELLASLSSGDPACTAFFYSSYMASAILIIRGLDPKSLRLGPKAYLCETLYDPTASTFLSPTQYGELFICDHRSMRQCPHAPPPPSKGSLPSATSQYGASARLPKGGAAFCHGVRGSPILI